MSKNLEKTYNPKRNFMKNGVKKSIFTLKLTEVRNHLQR